MFGVIVNTLGVVIGSIVGLLLKRGIPERISSAMMKALGLCTVYIGISGALSGQNTLVLILSMTVGTAIGEGLDLDYHLNHAANAVEQRFHKPEAGKVSIAEGFVTASIIFCIGAMTIVGSLQAGLTGNLEMLMTKSVLDTVSAVIFASSMGIGVLLAGVFVLLFQGGIVLLAQFVAPVFTDFVIAEMTCAGSVAILALGLNLSGITHFKIINFLPAVFLPILLCPLFIMLGIA